jgi:hypothetical protein
MTKLNWNRPTQSSVLNSEYYTNPKKGFDSAWHTQKSKLNIGLGIHLQHDWQAIKSNSGPHEGKAVCITCGNKFIMWLPKGYFNSNT